MMVVTKGAPEIVKNYLKTVPEGYDKCYINYVKNGARVLVVAYKKLPKMSDQEINSYKRVDAEKDLIFCGFLISECPLKPDTKKSH
jgi:cation-transporting ATPase 13A1